MVAHAASNTYSPQWFAAFHAPIRDTRTKVEVEFICSVAPLPDFCRIADVCCGAGRHARALAEHGYCVTAIDRDSTILAQALRLGGATRYVQTDLRDYSPAPDEYDVFAIMGQSFGHFDAATNQAVLCRLALGLRRHGRLILDLWAPAFFHAHQGEHQFHAPDGTVREMKRVNEDRLFVHLIYPNGNQEDFEWQMFTPEAIDTIARAVGLRRIACCTDWDSSVPPCPSKPRIQFVLERV
jgi:SAM-dependent methyltransferase